MSATATEQDGQAAPPPPRRGGRPSRLRAEQIGEDILAVATTLFLTRGYGATSIEAVAQQAHISKRTFYHRFRDKPQLFGAVVHRLIGRLHPPGDTALFSVAVPLEDLLLRLAQTILRGALAPESLALYRVVVAEATRFPELAAVLDAEGTRRNAIDGIAALLASALPPGDAIDPHFAAEQFLHLVVAAPQRRALGLGTAMTQRELADWARQSVRLFLRGCTG